MKNVHGASKEWQQSKKEETEPSGQLLSLRAHILDAHLSVKEDQQDRDRHDDHPQALRSQIIGPSFRLHRD
jgi:hypothetical protein